MRACRSPTRESSPESLERRSSTPAFRLTDSQTGAQESAPGSQMGRVDQMGGFDGKSRALCRGSGFSGTLAVPIPKAQNTPS